MVLNKRPCHFNHWIFALERWEPFTSEDFPNTIPFWIKVTGVPVHYWSDQTFDEIARALGRREAIDATNARFQVSVNADEPLQTERRVGFPNGDTGKVQLTYEGLNRFCFACKRISHDIYVCPNVLEEEREHKIKEYRELNSLVAETNRLQIGVPGYRNLNPNNKRPRSPASEDILRSPDHSRSQHPGPTRGEKRIKAVENYWSSRSLRDDRYPSSGFDRKKGLQYETIQQEGLQGTCVESY